MAQNAATRARAAAGAAAAAKAAADTAKAAADTAKADADTAKAAADAAKAAADAANATARDATTAEAAEAAQELAEAEQAKAEAAQATAEAEQAKAAAAQATAEAEQAKAAAAQELAETEQANAQRYAGMVAAAQQVINDERQRVMDVASARSAAMASYMNADADATKAEMQAAEAEETAPGTPGAVAAKKAADDARAAANAAKAAYDAITDDMTKAQADAQAAMAATEAGKANAGYVTAKAENDDIQTVSGITNEQLRERDVAAATDAAEDAAQAARMAATNARTHAGNARTAATAANNAYMRAKSARTDSEEAKKQYMAADAAAMAAERAATAAETAAGAAEDAHEGIDSAGSAADAQAAQMTAEARQVDAETQAGTANTQMGTANTARDDAVTASNKHVVGLLMRANGSHITTAADRETHVEAVNRAVLAANADSPVASSPAPPFHGSVDVTATWHYYGDLGDDNAPGGTGANADTEPGEGNPVISLTFPGSATALRLIHAEPAEGDNAATPANFKEGPGLGAFSHEKYIDRYNDADTSETVNAGDSYQRVILFTDLTQAKATVPAKSVSLTNEPVSIASRITPTARPNVSPGATQHDFAGTYDHDGNPDTTAITGTFDCVDTATCRVERSGTGSDGAHVDGQTKVTSISGYRFSGTGTTAEVLSMPDDTWLAFGVWLTETVGAPNTFDFGAFADGGAAIGGDGEPTAANVALVTGDAKYEGKAAGVHSKATAVNFFHADATLNAKFGDGTEFGTITGMIHNIVSGGDSVPGSIELVVTDPGNANPVDNILGDNVAFTGRARMQDTGENDSSGEDIYRYTGGWSGRFYNHMANDGDTDVDEASRAPGSVAGTFGVGRADVSSTTDVDETESYVGAFGAHCSGTNCNPHD